MCDEKGGDFGACKRNFAVITLTLLKFKESVYTLSGVEPRFKK